MLDLHYGNSTEQVSKQHPVKTSERHKLEVVMDSDICDLSISKERSLTLTPDDDDVQAPMSTECGVREKKQERIEADNEPADDEPYDPQDQLCTGERIDDEYDLKAYRENPKEENEVNGNNNLKADDNNSCSEKRRQFSLTHSPGSSAFHSVDSASSELSSHSRHSVSSFLQAREYDAEDVLLSLGLGLDCRMSVPERFLVNSSSAKGIDVGVIRRNIDEEEDDIFDTNSLSYSSSWSERNQILERLPNRFVTSTSSLGSTTDLSEPEYVETVQISPVPVIVEPEQNDENSFDLMRHLRLNRIQNHLGREHQHERILLEPVTEELEVSSVGSGSARSKISNTQQDSLDSLGNTSVLTKISRRHSEDSFKDRILLDNSSFQIEPPEDNQQAIEEPVQDDVGNSKQEYRDNEITSLENSNTDAQTNQGDNESGISSAGDSVNLNAPHALKPPVLRVLASDTAHHDSFELEEIATSEENLDKIDDKRSTEKKINGNTRQLKRENSDESSGFEDDTQVKKRSSESLDKDDVKTCSLANQNDSDVNSFTNDIKKHLVVPIEVSTQKTDAELRRSAFAKRSAWSTSKQKRVAFQDEALVSKPKSRSFDERNLSAYKLETRRYSIDIPLTCTDTHKANQEDETQPDNKGTSKICQLESTPEKTAVHNIRKFLSSLMSIRSRFRKDVQAEKEVVPITDISSTSLVSVHDAGQLTEGSDSGLLRHDVEQAPRDERQEVTNDEVRCLISRRGVYQKHYLEELDSLEEDLNKYRSTFMTMEMTSTSQESYHTKKSLARFAWDIVAIRRLRSLIKNELDTMESSLTDRKMYVSELSVTPLPHGIVEQMNSILTMQSSLQNYLLKLAKSVPCFHWKTTSSPLLNRSTVNTSEINTQEMTNEIKHSLFQDLNKMFQEQVEGLRKELKEKDDVINELLIKVERIEKSSYSSKH